MKRTRLTAAMLAATMSISTVHVAVPEATAQTVQTRTVSEVDQDAYSKAVEEWQHNRDAAETELQEAHDAVASAEQRVTDAGEALGRARGVVDKARAALAEAEAALAAVDVDARQQEADDAAAELQSAEDRLAAAQQRVDDARSTRDNAQAELDDLSEQLATKRDELENATNSLEEANADVAAARAERARIEERIRTGADYSLEDWRHLTGQAVAELINEYREANGLHPLVTHEIYIEQAQAWSDQMAADTPVMGADAAFRHSDGDEYGHSGENIAAQYPGVRGDRTRKHWVGLPVALFEQWRNSPGHNKGMLDSTFEGMGLGITVDDNGNVFATTMFFNDDLDFEDGWYRDGDESTRRAQASGTPFYLPSGAREVMQADPITDPLTDTKGVTPSYGDLVSDTGELSRRTANGFDPVITQVDYDAQFRAVDNDERYAQFWVSTFTRAVEHAQQGVDELEPKVDLAHIDVNQAQDGLDRATISRDATRDDRDAAASAKNAADEALEVARNTPKQPLIDDLSAANDNLTSSEQALADDEAALEDAREGLAEADRAVGDKQDALERIDAAKPAEDDFIVEREVVETLAPAPARVSGVATASVPVAQDSVAQDSVAADAGTKSEGSSTGAVIGVILAILAVVGIAAVAVPKVMEQR